MGKELHQDRINALEVSLGLKEKSAIELFYENPCERTLRKVSKRIQTPEMVQLAIENDGTAIKSVSKKLITEDLCKAAVMQNGLALYYIPDEFITKEIIKLAVAQSGTAISIVPKSKITKSLAKIAVCQTIKLKGYGYYQYPISYIPNRFIDEQLVIESIKNSSCSLKDIPKEFIPKDILLLAVTGDGEALEFVPQNRISKTLINAAISNCPTAIKYVPESKITKELCDEAFEGDPFVLRYIPERFITPEMCLTIIEASDNDIREKRFSIEWIPEKMRNNKIVIDAIVNKYGANYVIAWNERLLQRIEEQGEPIVTTKPLTTEMTDYLKSIIAASDKKPLPLLHIADVETPAPSSDAILVKRNTESCVYDLTLNDDSPSKTVYYISDIHLEHQLRKLLEKGNVSYRELSEAIDKKISEMMMSVNNHHGYLLVGGDVGHHKGLVTLFYRKLTAVWNGTVVSVLGNHELWDDNTDFLKEGYVSRSVTDIVNDYRERIQVSKWFGSCVLLQNELLIRYKNREKRIISEEMILTASDDDLRDVLLKADFILLGGIGFSGLNQHYNAELGLYRSTITSLQKDKELSAQFERIYEKVLRCAEDIQVIVLTHTPVYDWTKKSCNPNWVYINGHTHQNSLIRNKDGTTVLSDNQVGYKPSKWKLNAFTISGWYDPFKDMEDGIHQITSEMYKDFNLARGIRSNGCNYPGVLYVLKRNGFYMFLLQSASSLCLLSGGQRKRLDTTDVNYYYNNMEKYAQKVQAAVSPYQSALHHISSEIKSIGGWGSIHGCIVDIDFFNHIYLNPFDGKITPYYAWDISSRLVYDDLPSLLKVHVPQLKDRFDNAHKSGAVPLLSQYAVAEKKHTEKMALATVPQLVLGTEIYEPSRIMKSIQYIIDNNIIRIWNDDILAADFENGSSILKIEDKNNK